MFELEEHLLHLTGLLLDVLLVDFELAVDLVAGLATENGLELQKELLLDQEVLLSDLLVLSDEPSRSDLQNAFVVLLVGGLELAVHVHLDLSVRQGLDAVLLPQ